MRQSKQLEEQQQQQWQGDYTPHVLPEEDAAHFCLAVLLQGRYCLHVDRCRSGVPLQTTTSAQLLLKATS